MTTRITTLGRIIVGTVLLLVLGLVLFFPRFEGTPPEVVTAPELAIGEPGRTLVVELADHGAGLRSVELRLLHQAGTRRILEKRYPGSWFSWGGVRTDLLEVPLNPKELGVPDGPATLVLITRDRALRDSFRGNRNETTIALRVDTKPPDLELESGLTYVYRGGSAAAVYRVDEAVERDGVQVEDHFFSGYALGSADPAGGGKRVALFAIPVDAPADPSVEVVAIDLAGNRSTARFPTHLLERQFSNKEVTLPARFLATVVPRLARENGVQDADQLAAFREINTELRSQNESTIRELTSQTSAQTRWRGAFQQMQNSAVTSRFAENRTYVVAGQPVSRSRHFGFDLASTAKAQVVASNHGVVLFSGTLGIYGKSVLLDHGLGLTTLYGHLSSLAVEAGDEVAQGETLGRSGATGLAGGDHLHFAILVGGTYVDPLEWWDPEWVRTHIEARINPGAR
ncbi:MAG: M23 family metallopeptidase [Myxococcota bacterium]